MRRRRSSGAQPRKRREPKAYGVSEPCGACSFIGAPAGAQRSGSGGEKEEGGCGYGVFAALTETAETEWSCLLPTWLGWQDSNLRMPESKSGALPLGDIPMCSGRQVKTCPVVAAPSPACGTGEGDFYGVSDGTRTHGLQSHNLTR